jgi:hypothetical protein
MIGLSRCKNSKSEKRPLAFGHAAVLELPNDTATNVSKSFSTHHVALKF